MVKRSYYALTFFLDTGLLGIFVGIISSMAVNVATSPDISVLLGWSIAANSFSVFCLVKLIRIRQQIDAAYLKREDIVIQDEERWAAAADYKNVKRVFGFILYFSFFLLSFGAGVACIIFANRANKEKAAITVSGNSTQPS